MKKQSKGRKRKNEQPKTLEEEMLASVHGSSSMHSMTAPLSDEVVKYYHVVKALDVDCFKDKDPLTFWGDDKNSIKFPILRRIALQVLPCQPTSGDVERTASKGSLIAHSHEASESTQRQNCF
jgi:hypothetical protein